MMYKKCSDKQACTASGLTLSLLGLLVITGGVRLQSVAAAVEGIAAVFVVEDAGEADLPLVAVAAEVRVQAQAAAVQVLRKKNTLCISELLSAPAFRVSTTNVTSELTTSGSVRGRGKQGKVSRRKVVISSNSWHAAIFRAKGQPHFVGFTVSLYSGWKTEQRGYNINTLALLSAHYFPHFKSFLVQPWFVQSQSICFIYKCFSVGEKTISCNTWEIHKTLL